MRVITFSRTFPAYHPKTGEPTYFVEKILNQFGIDFCTELYAEMVLNLNEEKVKRGKLTNNQIRSFIHTLIKNRHITDCKRHTIRSGHRWKIGDKFSPRVWSGKPYRSPQIIIAPDIEVKKVWYFEIKNNLIFINNSPISIVEYRELIARNDGLNYQDFKDWFKFPKPFHGQIICYDENVNY